MSITLRAYIFFGIICFLGIIDQWIGGGQYSLWRILAVAFVAALVVERIIARKSDLALTRELPLRVYLGRKFNYHIKVANYSQRKIQLEGVESNPATVLGSDDVMQLVLPSQSESSKVLSVIPTMLGPLQGDRFYSRIRGLLGLANWSRVLSDKITTQVVPDHLRLSEIRTGSLNLGDLHRRRFGSGFELLGLRDYQPGDSLRSIDWKATARSGRHTVRIFTEEQRLELTLLVDVGRRSALQAGSLTRLGHYINVAARLAEKTIREGNSVNIICFADQLLASSYYAKGNAGLLRIRGLLEKLESQTTDSNLLPAIFEARRKTRQRNLMVVLTDLDETSVDSQLIKGISLLVPKHLPLIASILDEDTVALETQYAHSWMDPYKTIAAHESLLESRRAALHLQRKGAHVIYAQPDKLDKEVMSYYARLLERNRL